MNGFAYIAAVILLSCSSANSSVQSSQPEERKNYVLSIRLLDEGNNFNNLMHVLNQLPAKLKVQPVLELGLHSTEKWMIRVYYTNATSNDMFHLKRELLKCKGIIELIESQQK